MTAGSNNTAVGSSSGGNVTTGSNNTFVGYLAGTDAAHGALTNATAIGANALVTQNNSLVLGGIGANAVSVGIGTSAPLKTLQVVGDIKVGTSGTERLPGELRRHGPHRHLLVGPAAEDERPAVRVRCSARSRSSSRCTSPGAPSEFPNRHYGNAVNSGLIAQDVEQVFPELVSTDDDGFKMVNYSELPYLTLQAVKELKAENDALKAQLAALAERLARLEKR